MVNKVLPAFQSKHLRQYQLHMHSGILVQSNNVLQSRICNLASTDNTSNIQIKNP